MYLFRFSFPILFGSLDIGEFCKSNCLTCQHPFMFTEGKLANQSYLEWTRFSSVQTSLPKEHHLELMEHAVYDVLFSW